MRKKITNLPQIFHSPEKSANMGVCIGVWAGKFGIRKQKDSG
ncbi:MAG: hypothetical protein PHX21_01865 [bacterium]|nr:hypothetical protein [bacterium]